MAAPLRIDEFIEDIINKLIASGRKLPLHILAMGKIMELVVTYFQ